MKCEFEECGATFSDSSALARHRKSHTGLRPHACSVPGCGKAFTRRTTLNQHMLGTHNGWGGDTGAKKRRLDDAEPLNYDEIDEDMIDSEIQKSVKVLTALLSRAKEKEDNGHASTSAGPSSGRGEALESRVAAISANIAAAIVQAQKRIAEEADEEADEDDMDSDDNAEMDVLGPLVSGIRDELLRPARREAEGSNASAGGSALMNAIASVTRNGGGRRNGHDEDEVDFAVPLRERRASGGESQRGTGRKRKR